MGIEYPFVDHRNVVGASSWGPRGYMIFPDYSSYYVFLGPDRKPGPERQRARQPDDGRRPFPQLDCCGAEPQAGRFVFAEIEEGHLSAALPHLANIAYRARRTVVFDAKASDFPATRRRMGFYGGSTGRLTLFPKSRRNRIHAAFHLTRKSEAIRGPRDL